MIKVLRREKEHRIERGKIEGSYTLYINENIRGFRREK
jgi:hypothetical protein